MPSLSDLMMVGVYFVLDIALLVVLRGILRQSRAIRRQFRGLTLISIALIICLLLDAIYWGCANAWRVYSGSPPASELTPNPWNPYAIILIKCILIVGVVFVSRLVRSAFEEAAKAAYSAAIEETNDAIGVLNPDGSVYYWNRAMYELFGFDPTHDVAGKDIRELIMAGEDMRSERESFDRAVKQLQEGPIKNINDNFLRRKDAQGRIKVIRVSMSRRNAPDGSFAGCFGIMKEGFDPVFPWVWKRMAQPIATARNNLITAHSKVCTAMFADIIGFSKLVEETDHGAVQELIGEFFAKMVDTIDENGGIVVDLLGDEVFAVFGVLDETELDRHNSAANALKAALQMQREFATISKRFVRRAQAISAAAVSKRPRLGIGINTGPMLIGQVGEEWLAHFTAVGLSVVRAKRVEELTHDPDGQYPSVLLTESTKTNIEHSQDPIPLRQVDTINLRLTGVEQESREVTVYTPLFEESALQRTDPTQTKELSENGEDLIQSDTATTHVQPETGSQTLLSYDFVIQGLAFNDFTHQRSSLHSALAEFLNVGTDSISLSSSTDENNRITVELPERLLLTLFSAIANGNPELEDRISRISDAHAIKLESVDDQEVPTAMLIWREKREQLLRDEAIETDSATKFSLRKQIEECERKIQELGGANR